MAFCRAYKLGKKRWSYNQCELKILQDGGDQRLDVVEAVQVSMYTNSIQISHWFHPFMDCEKAMTGTIISGSMEG